MLIKLDFIEARKSNALVDYYDVPRFPYAWHVPETRLGVDEKGIKCLIL